MSMLQCCARRWVFMVALAMLFGSGCSKSSGPRRVALRGKVNVQGQPLTAGSVNFLPVEGHKGPVASCGIEQGAYRFTAENGPTPGPHRVVISLGPVKGSDSVGAPGGTTKTRWEIAVTVSEETPTRDFDLEK